MKNATEIPPSKEARDAALADKKAAMNTHQIAWKNMQLAHSKKQALQTRRDTFVRNTLIPARESYSQAQSLHLEAMFIANDQLAWTKHHLHQLQKRGRSARRRRDNTTVQTHRRELQRLKQLIQHQINHRQKISKRMHLAKERFEPLLDEHRLLHRDYLASSEQFSVAQRAFYDAKHTYAQARRTYEAKEQAYQIACGVNPLWHHAHDVDSLAKIAEIDNPYLKNLKVDFVATGEVNIYYGGIGEPIGDGHGHRVLIPPGRISYIRDPFEPRGPHNFITQPP